MSALDDEIDKNTFMTGINAEGGGKVPLDAESMKRVYALHGKLTGVVDTLSSKVSGVLQKQEKEFLQAYRAHMYNVQKELQQLRARLDDAEMSLKKNDKIRKLEEARDWFREEALRLVSILISLYFHRYFFLSHMYGESMQQGRRTLTYNFTFLSMISYISYH